MTIQEQTTYRPIRPAAARKKDSLRSSLGIVVASIITTLGLAGGGFFLYQQWEAKQENNSTNPATQATANQSSTPNADSQTDPTLQPALGGKAEIKILSAYRLQDKPDEVAVEMRVSRISENNIAPDDTLDPGATQARNLDTGETYSAVNPFTQASKPISLAEIRPDRSVNAYVVLKVPQSTNQVDIFIPKAEPFRKVAIAGSNPNPTSRIPQSQTPPTPELTPLPSQGIPLPPPPATREPIATSTPTKAAVKPGQFANFADGNKAKIELLSVQRIKNPNSGKRDIVNVQMRIRRLADDRAPIDSLNLAETTARDPQTSQVFKSAGIQRSTGTVFLGDIKPGASADAYVWLTVPETVKTLNLYIPKTKAFNNLPISN